MRSFLLLPTQYSGFTVRGSLIGTLEYTHIGIHTSSEDQTIKLWGTAAAPQAVRRRSVRVRDHAAGAARKHLFLRRSNHIGIRTSGAVTASEALWLDLPFVDAFHQRRHHRIGGYRCARNIQIAHDSEPGIGHV